MIRNNHCTFPDQIKRILSINIFKAFIQYSFKDKNPILGKSYYRLKQVDYNGYVETYDIISTKCNESEYQIRPNPPI